MNKHIIKRLSNIKEERINLTLELHTEFAQNKITKADYKKIIDHLKAIQDAEKEIDILITNSPHS